MMFTRSVRTVLGGSLMIGLAGCYSPSGGMMARSGGAITFTSDETMQKTITVVDVRNNEVVFSMDVPVGKQLVIDFDENLGDNPVYTPDLMRYQVFEAGTRIGRLRNSITVPNAESRRLEVALRRTVEYAPASAMRALRTDELADRPAWWTPQGGPLPDKTGAEIYDK